MLAFDQLGLNPLPPPHHPLSQVREALKSPELCFLTKQGGGVSRPDPSKPNPYLEMSDICTSHSGLLLWPTCVKNWFHPANNSSYEVCSCYQKHRTKLSLLLLLLLLLQDCCQIFTTPSKSLQALKTFACVSLRYRKHCGGGGGWWVGGYSVWFSQNSLDFIWTNIELTFWTSMLIQWKSAPRVPKFHGGGPPISSNAQI